MSDEFARLCDPECPYLARPFAVGDHAVATDNHLLLALRGVTAEPPDPAYVGKLASIATWLAEPKPHEARPVALADLRAFAGEPAWGEQCSSCGGTGRAPPCPQCGDTKRVSCECRECGNEHDAACYVCGDGKCDDCGGTGLVRDGAIVAVEVAGVVVQRNYLARLLACATGDGAVRIALLDGGACLGLWGDGWHARIMAVQHPVTATFRASAGQEAR